MSEPFGYLVAMSPRARAAAADCDVVTLWRLPFRIGRECRLGVVDGHWKNLERRKPNSPPNNDLYLHDPGEALQISREHVLIRPAERGGFEAVDRGSTCGTLVDGVRIGRGERSESAPLKDGSLIVIGTPESPFVYRFLLCPPKGPG